MIDKAIINISHPNANLLNKRITEEYLKVQKAVIELEGQDAFDFDALKDCLKGQVKAQPPASSTTFKSFSEQLVKDMLAMSMPVNNKLLRKNDVVENVTRTPSVLIRGNTITRIPTRGMLVTTRRKITIVGNTIIGTHDSGISIADDANSWYESGKVEDFTARNNSFINCGEPVININPENIEKGQGIYVHKHINILDNVFKLRSRRALFAKSTTSINIERNKFQGTGQPLKESELFDLRDCARVIIKGNELKRPLPAKEKY